MKDKVRYYIPETASQHDLASALAENNTGPFEKRITKAEPFKVDRLGFPDFPYGTKNLTKRRELDAVGVAAEMARREGYTSFVWVSPPGGDDIYPGCRITLVNVRKIDDDFVHFDDNRGICGDLSPRDCLNLSRKLEADGGRVWGEPKSAEELRSFMIGFKGGKEGVVDLLAKHVTRLEDVWNAIKTGKDGDYMNRYLDIAQWVNRNFGYRMTTVRNEHDSIRLGAQIEMMIKVNFGLSLMDGGGHGASNVAVMRGNGGVFDQARYVGGEALDSRLVECPGCHKAYLKKRGKCPKCHPDN